jgi:hypothetical protein
VELPAENISKSGKKSALGSAFSQSAVTSEFRIMFINVCVPNDIKGDDTE